jgi:hypothetical protein
MRTAQAPKRDIENNGKDGRPRKKPQILLVYGAVITSLWRCFLLVFGAFFTSLWRCFLLVYGAVFYQSMALFFTSLWCCFFINLWRCFITSLWRCFFTSLWRCFLPVYKAVVLLRRDNKEVQPCFCESGASLRCVLCSLIVNLN